jgi:hypothetical protein
MAVPFDKELIEAQLALDLISTAEMPKLAWDALEAGMDGPAIRRLAAFEKPTGFEVDEVLPRAIKEMQLSIPTPAHAARILMRQRALDILESGVDPLARTNDFLTIWFRSGYPSDLTLMGNLDDEVNIGRCKGQSEQELRDWVTKELKNFLER